MVASFTYLHVYLAFFMLMVIRVSSICMRSGIFFRTTFSNSKNFEHSFKKRKRLHCMQEGVFYKFLEAWRRARHETDILLDDKSGIGIVSCTRSK